MRKDVKLVVAAACLLLVGLLGYVLFAPTHKAADVAVDDTGKSGSESTSTGGTSETASTNTQAVTPETSPIEVTLAPTTQPTTPTVSIGLGETPSPTTVPSTGTGTETVAAPAGGPTDWQTTLNTGSVATATGSATGTTTSAGGLPVNTLIGATEQPKTTGTGTGTIGTIAGTTGGTQTGTTPTAPAGSKTHKVAYGETLSSIAADHYGNKATYAKIVAANPSVNPNKLKVGTVLVIPALPSDADATTASGTKAPGATAAVSGNSYTVKSGDSLQKIAQTQFGSSDKWQKIYDLNRSQIGGDPHRLKVGMTLKLPEK